MKSFGVICNLPPKTLQVLAFLDHLFKRKTASKIVFISEDSSYKDDPRLEHFELIENAPKMMGYQITIRVSDSMAAQMFCNAIKVAAKHDFEYFIWLETDCCICQDNWDLGIAGHVLATKAECGGTPVYFNPIHSDIEWAKRFTEYSCFYSKVHDVPIALEGGRPQDDWRYKDSPILFPNGALAIYRTEMLLDAFGNALMDFIEYRHDAIFFDQAVGIHLAKKYGPKVFSKVMPLSSIYSGCGNHYLDWPTRKAMAESGAYAAIHQYNHHE